MSANVRETLEGEYTLSFTVLAKTALALKVKQIAKLDDQYFEIVQISKSLQGSLPICSVICEHVSYVLNHEMYNIKEFDFTGDPAAGLAQVLSGTPFNAGQPLCSTLPSLVARLSTMVTTSTFEVIGEALTISQ
jgi:hypothetical protein